MTKRERAGRILTVGAMLAGVILAVLILTGCSVEGGDGTPAPRATPAVVQVATVQAVQAVSPALPTNPPPPTAHVVPTAAPAVVVLPTTTPYVVPTAAPAPASGCWCMNGAVTCVQHPNGTLTCGAEVQP